MKKRIGHGATPQSVIKCAMLKELVLAKYPGTDEAVLGVLMVELLKEAIATLPENEAEAARYLWKLHRKSANLQARVRQEKAMELIVGYVGSWETWRRPTDPSPELDFCRIVAGAVYKHLQGQLSAV